MAVHMPAEIVPGKLELLAAWVPGQPWADGIDTSTLSRLGSYRFDDPGGEVGIETHLLATADGTVLQVPLTYRGALRDDAGAPGSLITTMTHSLLGKRWIYDGCDDPVYVQALAAAILTGGQEAPLYMLTDDGLVLQPGDTHVQGSGAATPAALDIGDLVVNQRGRVTRMAASRTVDLLRIPVKTAAATSLTGTWPGQQTPLTLAVMDCAVSDSGVR